MKPRKVITFIFLPITMFFLFILLYFYFHKLNIEAPSELSREEVLKINGEPCGTAYYKCCGREVDGEQAQFYDVWESPNIFGSYRASVYYNENKKVISKETKFQWFYEAELKGLKRDANSCMQHL